MNELVFIEPNKIGAVPFTTSDVIAEYAGIDYRSVQRTIEKQSERLSKFGRVRFEITPTQTKGGVQDKKIYHLTEEQATLLITFLKNTDRVADFKTELVRQFYLMRSELQKREISRMALKPIRRELTDVIKEIDRSKWDYKLYTDLAYKLVTGMNAAQLRKDRNAPKDSTAIEYMTSDEIERVAGLTHKIGVLLEMGLDYYQIKALLVNRQMLGRLA
jgi:phage regulator Rha-like protein